MDWLPGFERIDANAPGGNYAGDGPPLILLHSTEGGTLAGAISTYRSSSSWPGITAAPAERRVAQHYPLGTSSRALVGESAAGVITNRRGRAVVQIELVMRAAEAPDMSDDALEWLGAAVIAPIAAAIGAELVTDVAWPPYPDSYGYEADQRLSKAAWLTARGIVGHMHVPGNDHGDPGALDVPAIIAAAGGSTPASETDDMTPEQVKALLETVFNTQAAVGRIELYAYAEAHKAGQPVAVNVADLMSAIKAAGLAEQIAEEAAAVIGKKLVD